MVNFKEDEQLKTLNHSCAHLMAQAIKHLYPQAKFWVGPVVAEGFYYDVDLGDDVILDEDITAIEKEMKKIAAPIRVELAQYGELAAFSQFGSELDASTAEQLAQGARIKEILKQPQYKPMPVEKQVIIIYAATKKYLIDIKIEDILRFEAELFDFIDTRYPEIPEAIREKKVMDDDTEQALIKAIEECKKQFR